MRCCFEVVESEEEVIRAAGNAQRSEQRSLGCGFPVLEMAIQGVESQSCVVVVEVVVIHAAKSERKDREWRSGWRGKEKKSEQRNPGCCASGLELGKEYRGCFVVVEGPWVVTHAAKGGRRSEQRKNGKMAPGWGTPCPNAVGHEGAHYCLVLGEEMAVRAVKVDQRSPDYAPRHLQKTG